MSDVDTYSIKRKLKQDYVHKPTFPICGNCKHFKEEVRPIDKFTSSSVQTIMVKGKQKCTLGNFETHVIGTCKKHKYTSRGFYPEDSDGIWVTDPELAKTLQRLMLEQKHEKEMSAKIKSQEKKIIELTETCELLKNRVIEQEQLGCEHPYNEVFMTDEEDLQCNKCGEIVISRDHIIKATDSAHDFHKILEDDTQ